MLYRKKPVVVKAIQYTGRNANEIKAFAGYCIADYKTYLEISTLEGVMRVHM